jgi:hypothetical protein
MATAQSGGEPTFAQACLNGEVAPIADLPALGPELRGRPLRMASRRSVLIIRAA